MTSITNRPTDNDNHSTENRSGFYLIRDEEQLKANETIIRQYMRRATEYFSTNRSHHDRKTHQSSLQVSWNRLKSSTNFLQSLFKRNNNTPLELSERDIPYEPLFNDSSNGSQIPNISDNLLNEVQPRTPERDLVQFVSANFYHILPENTRTTPFAGLDDSHKCMLIQVFLVDFFAKLPPEKNGSEEAKQDLIKYSKSVFRNEPNKWKQIEDLIQNDHLKNVIRLYTNPALCIFNLISKVFGSLDLEGVVDTRLIHSPLYQELIKLYQLQLKSGELRGNNLKIHRGKLVPKSDLNQLMKRGQLCIMRPFLSATIDELVARAFVAEGSATEETVRVIITMIIGPEQVKNSVFAFISEKSCIESENEVLHGSGLIFYVDSYNDSGSGASRLVHILMVHGKDERNLQESLREEWRSWLATINSSKVSIDGMSKIAYQVINHAQGSDQPQTVTVEDSVKTKSLDSNNFDNHDLKTDQCSLKSFKSKCEEVNQSKKMNTFLRIFWIMLLIITIGFILVIMVLYRHYSNTTDRDTAPICRTSCAFFTSVDNPSSNYQGEQLNFTCTRTLTNMTLTTIVQRNYNETYAQQYQTFWNQSTNTTYSVTPSQIIYTWFSWFHMYIVANSFPHFVRMEFYYTPGFTRITSNDTWAMTATTVCGESISRSGTF